MMSRRCRRWPTCRYAITSWASNANKLTVYLVGQGTNGLFRLNESETLAPPALRTWLDTYQSSNTGGVGGDGFSGSGRFPSGAGAIAGPEPRLCGQHRGRPGLPLCQRRDGEFLPVFPE